MHKRVLLSGVVAIAACGSDPPGERAEALIGAPASGGAEVVTLITGDRVIYTAGASGPSAHFEPGPGRAHVGFFTMRHGDDLLVVPNDVAHAVASGQLDRALFDVTKLVELGYGDRRRADIPLILTGPAPKVTGLTVDRDLPALHAITVRQPKASGGAALASLGNGTKIWLDRVHKIQITPGAAVAARPAPAAPRVAPRFTGAGVTVAVLDTGIDSTHPDLAGKVIAAQDFTGDGRTALDVFGEGTHVASVIAGSGAASGGQFAGVAPDAKLLDGRVCTVDDGLPPFLFLFCDDSAVLAGMEWAVVEQHAKVVNLSILGTDAQDIDPLQLEANELSRQFGTLFVTAAGDYQVFGEGELSTPGSADAALAVGAVDAAGALAEFSSVGPRLRDGAIKPDLTALGVDVVGARASGVPLLGAAVGTAYQSLSTTSVAAPRAAGAAALLLEQHPEWTGDQLKAALTGAADPDATLTAFQQGSGRLDIARATRQPVIASVSSLSLPLAVWPHTDDPVLDRTVSYRNTGATAVHLTLRAGLRGPGLVAAPAGMARVTPAAIDVPAGGSADVVVTIDSNGDQPDGRYEGALVATTGDLRITTPIAIEREVESHELTIRVTDLDGQPALATVPLIGLADNSLEFLDVAGEVTVRRKRQTYTAFALVGNPLVMAFPRLTLDHDLTASFDGTLAQPIALKIVGVDFNPRSEEIWYLDAARRFAFQFGDVDEAMFSAHFGPESSEVRSWSVVSTLEPFEQDQPTTVYELAHQERGHFLTGWSEVIEPRQLARVEAHHLAHGESGWRKWASVVLDDAPELGPLGGELGFADYPGAFDRTEFYYGPGFRFDPLVFEDAATFVDFPLNVGEETRAKVYRPGSRSVERWHQAPFGPAFAELNGFPSAQRIGDELRVTPSMFSDQGEPARLSSTLFSASRKALFRDGVLIAERLFNEDFFPPLVVPPGAATYRYEQSVSRGSVKRFSGEPLFELSPEVSAAWTFRSAHVDRAALALPTLRFTPTLDASNATAARVFVLPFLIERPVGAPTPRIVDARLEVSFDDGAHWANLPVARIDDHGLAIVLHPRGARFVSLRGSARDVAGNQVEQTIIHAYGLAR